MPLTIVVLNITLEFDINSCFWIAILLRIITLLFGNGYDLFFWAINALNKISPVFSELPVEKNILISLFSNSIFSLLNFDLGSTTEKQ